MDIELIRFAYTPTEVQGRMLADDRAFYTIERPWIPADTPGGKPFESCVPDGDYELVPFERNNGDHVLALVNHDLGVHLHSGPRYAILIHAGNWVTDVVGCIAPGMDREIEAGRIKVTNSQVAMRSLADIMDFSQTHTLHIHPTGGTV